MNSLARQASFSPLLSCLISPPRKPTKILYIDIHLARAMSNRAAAIRKKFPRFRVLVIGRANAGKTSLLQRLCKTTEFPIGRDRNGNEVSVDFLCRNWVTSNQLSLPGQHRREGDLGCGYLCGVIMPLLTSYSVASMTLSMKFHFQAMTVLFSMILVDLRLVAKMNSGGFSHSLRDVLKNKGLQIACMSYGSS